MVTNSRRGVARAALAAAYGAAFVVGVPLLLVVWARRSAPMVPLPAVRSAVAGWATALAGGLLLLAGMRAIVRHGRGLPMNAFPPPRLVREGVYGWLHDPIYVGFGLVVLGVSIAAGSASGLWLVTPATWLAMAALVLGHERHDLRRRFGDAALGRTRLSLPPADAEVPDVAERLTTLVRVFVPWLLVYAAAQALGRPRDAFSTMRPGEPRWPVLAWLEWPYATAYLLVPLAVLAARTRRALRDFAASGLAGTVVVGLCWLLIPVAAFPAFHVLWTMLAARAWSAGRRPAARALAWGWAALVAVSAVATGQHGVLDVAAGAMLYLPLRDVGRSWAVVRGGVERVANSWREWRAGPLRFINHGVYAGAAAAVGLTIAGSAAHRELAVVWVGLWILLGAGAYAQVLEGSSRLLRPFGWYGGVIGGVVGIVTSPLVGGAILPLTAAFALAAPWIQALGRLRCLVQGCCHGAPAPADVGIRYHHPRSRVAQLAHLAGVPLHPTPLYSIAGNVVIGLVLVRLRVLAAPDSLLLGVYLVLSGCARFVEESYRGEPQTPIVAGLRIYQWFAVATLLAGVVCTMLPTPPNAAGFARPSASLVAWAAVVFVVFAAAMGLDVPGSNRRFSRLASAD